MKTIIILLVTILFYFDSAAHAQLKDKKLTPPKLVVVIMIDQFRADYLSRFKNEFLPAKGRKKEVGGFNYLMKKGAYYPYAQYDILQSLTGPGHSTILTGSYPYQSGVPLNEWFDRSTNEFINCVEDKNHKIIGINQKHDYDGRSPKNLIGTTVGDELKSINKDSRVVAVSLKDRASILMGGHRADLAMWFDDKEHKWVTSSHYLKTAKLPSWMESLNKSIEDKKGFGPYKDRFESPTVSPYGIELTNQAVYKAVEEYQLGQGKNTDILAISYSSHDYVGHVQHINTAQMKEMTLVEDREISKLINFILTKNQLEDVVFVLSADHGVAPNIEELVANKINAGYLGSKDMQLKITKALDKKFGTLPDDVKWLSGHKVFNFYINKKALDKKKLASSVVEDEIKKTLLTLDGIAHAVTKSDIQKGVLPPGMHQRQLLKSYYPGRSGDVIAIVKPFFLNGTNKNSHMTGYSYDKTVPLIIMGNYFKPGIYPKIVEVVDLAPTLSFILGVVPPSSSEGRVLTEAFE